MPATTRSDGEAGPPAGAVRLVLELTMVNGELASGTVGAEGGSAPISFYGWIGLMSAIGQLTAKEGGPGR